MPRLKEYKYDAWASWAWEQHKLDKPSIMAIDTEANQGWNDEPYCATLTWRGRDGLLKSS